MASLTRRRPLLLGCILLVAITMSSLMVSFKRHETHVILRTVSTTTTSESISIDCDKLDLGILNDGDKAIATAAASCLQSLGGKRTMDYGSNSHSDGETNGCKLPKLNPFHKDALKYQKAWKKQNINCKGNRYGKISNGTLHLKVANVNTVILYAIGRPEKDDFKETYDYKATISKHPKVNIETDKTGCIVLRESGHLLQQTASGTLHFSEQRCVHHYLVHFNSNGKLEMKDFKSCFEAKGKDIGSEVVASNCDSGSDFEVIDGQVVEKTSGYCLGNSDGALVLKKCIDDISDAEGDLQILDADPQDLNVAIPVEDDFLQLDIYVDGKMHKELYSNIVPKIHPTNHKDSMKRDKLNIVLLLMESQSNANVIRSMKDTYQYLNKLNSFVFQGHTIVGDGTTAQLCAILTGEREEKLPESRRGKKDSKPVDNWPFIFKDAKSKGYVTLFTEDDPALSSFNYRLKGFDDPPTDHYGRPFWLAADHWINDQCVFGVRNVDILLNQIMEFHDKYPRTPKLTVSMITGASHEHAAGIKTVDAHALRFVKEMEENGHLNNTVLIIAGDHGARTSEFRATIQGKLEERLPFLSITVPPWMLKKHLDVKKALEHNVNTLTSHFDIHATFRNIFEFPKVEEKLPLGHSLLRMIDRTKRTCLSAGVDEHWCPCLAFDLKPHNNAIVRRLSEFVVDYINNEIITKHDVAVKLCYQLELVNVLRAGMRQFNKKVEKFSGTRKNEECDSCGVEYKGKALINVLAYEIVISVAPSNGVFEATVYVNGRTVYIDPNISRINRYHEQPACVHDRFPFLRKFCMCK